MVAQGEDELMRGAWSDIRRGERREGEAISQGGGEGNGEIT